MTGDIINVNEALYELSVSSNYKPQVWYDGDGYWAVKLNQWEEPFRCSKQLAMTYKNK